MSANPIRKVVDQPNIPFIDLAAQQRKIRNNIERAILKVLDHGQYVMGPEIKELEDKLSDYCGIKHTLSCSNGTDALVLALMALEVGPGDAVLVPSFTFVATAQVVNLVGATPIFIDICPDTFNIDSSAIEVAIQKAKQHSLKPKGIIPVDLFGLPAAYDEIHEFAKAHGLWVISDAAQSFGAEYKGKKSGSFASISCTSFFPAKPLGCYGDGGAVFTDNDEIIEKLRSLRMHGYGKERYHHVRIGMNGRMDTIQAAILLEKLKIFDEELTARQKIADRYTDALSSVGVVQKIPESCRSAWAQYTFKVNDRDQIIEKLQKRHIPHGIYYPIPLHEQPCYQGSITVPETMPISRYLSENVLSLPMHPYLEEETQDFIIETVLSAT